MRKRGKLYPFFPHQGLDAGPVELAEEQAGRRQGGQLRNREGPPDIVHVAGKAQQVGHRQQHQQLTAQGDDGGVAALAQRLEGGG